MGAGGVNVSPYKDHAAKLLEGVLKTSSPVFDKSTEEGLRFRIYRMGSLEVRTTQDAGCDEAVGAVFSIRSTTSASWRDNGQRQAISTQERVVHATEFVERTFMHSETPGALRRYYLVLETANLAHYWHTFKLSCSPSSPPTKACQTV